MVGYPRIFDTQEQRQAYDEFIEFMRVNDPDIYKQLNPPEFDCREVLKQLKDTIRKCERSHNPLGPTLFFVTINFKLETTIDEMHQCMARVVSRSFIKNYWYSFEQGGDGKDRAIGYHPHVHMILTDCKHPAGQLRRDLYNTVKKHVGCPKHVDVGIHPLSRLSDKLAYLNGIKDDPEKDAKIACDVEWRRNNNLASIYTNALP